MTLSPGATFTNEGSLNSSPYTQEFLLYGNLVNAAGAVFNMNGAGGYGGNLYVGGAGTAIFKPGHGHKSAPLAGSQTPFGASTALQARSHLAVAGPNRRPAKLFSWARAEASSSVPYLSLRSSVSPKLSSGPPPCYPPAITSSPSILATKTTFDLPLRRLTTTLRLRCKNSTLGRLVT